MWIFLEKTEGKRAMAVLVAFEELDGPLQFVVKYGNSVGRNEKGLSHHFRESPLKPHR